MTNEAKDLLDRALQLPEEEREALALAMLDSVGAEDPQQVERAWAVEVRKRVADLRAGRVAAAPWAEARRRIFARPSQ